MGKSYANLHDPDAEYAVRELSAGMMGVAVKHGGGRDVEITDVQTTMVGGNFPRMLVHIYIDAGVVGTGGTYWDMGMPEFIGHMEPLVIGESPLDISRLYRHLVQEMSGEGSAEGVTVTAISGVKAALHDLAGKTLGIPTYQLLGGKYRDKTRTYCGCHIEEEADPEVYADEVERMVDGPGYNALKFDLDVPSGHEKNRANRHLCPDEIRRKAKIVEKIAERVKDKTDVVFDCHWMFSGGNAKCSVAKLEDYDVQWLEDPVPPENLDMQEEVTKSTFTPITVGENRYRMTELHRPIENQTVDTVAPDTSKVSGMRETQETADVVNQYYVPIVMYNVPLPIAMMAPTHVGTAIPNSPAVEYYFYELGWREDPAEETVIKDGYIEILEKPDLGVTLDMDIVEEHMVDGETLFDGV